MKIIIIISIVLFFANKTNAQWREYIATYPDIEREYYPNVKVIKRKSYGDKEGRKGFWQMMKLDEKGRVIEKQFNRKRNLGRIENFVYNSNNDILYHIITYPNRISDTAFCYKYNYENGRIIYEKFIYLSSNDSTVIQLLKNYADTTLVYLERYYYHRKRTNVTDINETKYILHYKDKHLVRLEEIKEYDKLTNFLEYYSNGMLKRQKTETASGKKIVSTGGHFGMDMFYKYKYDRFGRVKKYYLIIEKKKYKMASYKYYER
ncbi:MAG: hypothetical protein LBR45_01150 [Bacteroidales bacterium]|jgi:hypothetical protein|nr:hypothetical protein [Bacteroidales bacterium]